MAGPINDNIQSRIGEDVDSFKQIEVEKCSGDILQTSLKPASPSLDPWGRSFRVKWLCTARLPFRRLQKLRNPWNKDREVKVSRDGTELEPSVGQRLIEEWDVSTLTRQL
jgi:hypothetical protein